MSRDGIAIDVILMYSLVHDCNIDMAMSIDLLRKEM